MKLNFLGSKCLQPQSIFGFLIKFMLSHSDAFERACSLCPFGYCYKYFIGSYAAFQTVYSAKELASLFQHPSAEDEDEEEVMFTVPYLHVPVTHHNFNIIRHTLCLSSNFDLFVRTLMSESVEELISFTAISLVQIVYAWISFCMHFHELPSGEKFLQMTMNIAGILNLSFLVCFIFENYKNCTSLH